KSVFARELRHGRLLVALCHACCPYMSGVAGDRMAARPPLSSGRAGLMHGLERRRRKRSVAVGSSLLQRVDVRRRGTLRSLLGVVAHLRAVIERLEAAALNSAVVNENVLARVIGRDEPEALVVAEPLNGSCCHVASLRDLCSETRRTLQRQRLRKRGHLK